MSNSLQFALSGLKLAVDSKVLDESHEMGHFLWAFFETKFTQQTTKHTTYCSRQDVHAGFRPILENYSSHGGWYAVFVLALHLSTVPCSQHNSTLEYR